jgi:hypothetical protein
MMEACSVVRFLVADRREDAKNAMNAMKLIVVGCAMALVACAATGPPYSSYVESSPDIPKQSTRLTFFRTAENTQYSARSATVRIDGREVGGCEFAGYQSFYVRAGPHVLSVDLWDSPGNCRLSIETLGGEEYFYEISPRPANAMASFLGFMIGSMGNPMGQLIAPYALIGAESAGKECGGPFSLAGVEEGFARQKLRELGRSR